MMQNLLHIEITCVNYTRMHCFRGENILMICCFTIYIHLYIVMPSLSHFDENSSQKLVVSLFILSLV